MTDEEAAKILEIAGLHADGYRRAINQFDDPEKVEQAEACACAASNTAWFVLRAFGYSQGDMLRLSRLRFTGERLPIPKEKKA